MFYLSLGSHGIDCGRYWIIFIDLTSHYLTVLSFQETHGETNITNGQVILRIPGWDNGGCWGRAVFWVLLTKMGQSAVIFGSCFLFCLKYENMRFIFGSCCFVMQLILIVFVASIIKIYKKHNLLITDTFSWLGVLNLAGSEHLSGDAAGTMYQSNPK